MTQALQSGISNKDIMQTTYTITIDDDYVVPKGKLPDNNAYLTFVMNNGAESYKSQYGYAFLNSVLDISLAEITKKIIINWIEKETLQDKQSHIKSGIAKQFDSLENKEIFAPWLPQIFQPN